MSDLSADLVGAAFLGLWGIGAYLITRTPRFTGDFGPISKENFSVEGSIPVKLSDESVWLCRCGQSKNFPYCDGSHNKFNEANGTNFSPMEMNAEKHGGDTIYVCRCGQSGKRKQGSPACDGTHRRLAAK